MNQLLKHIFKLFLLAGIMLWLFFPSIAFANFDEPQDPGDSIVHRPFFSGVEFSLDYGKLITYPSKFENKLEGGVSLRFFQRLALAGEYGHATLDPLKAYDNVNYYTIQGNYFRAGFDYYMNIDQKNFIYFGARYGSSKFEDNGEFVIGSEFWGNYQDGFGSQNLMASWGELVFGTETKLMIGKPDSKFQIKNLFMGWNLRFRILGTFENREVIKVYAIPGYGRTADKTIPAINFYVKYRIGT